MAKKVVLLTALMTVICCIALAADLDGRWTAEVQGRGSTQTQTLTLRAAGSNLTGSLDAGRGGAVDISEGTIDGSNVSFKPIASRCRPFWHRGSVVSPTARRSRSRRPLPPVQNSRAHLWMRCSSAGSPLHQRSRWVSDWKSRPFQIHHKLNGAGNHHLWSGFDETGEPARQDSQNLQVAFRQKCVTCSAVPAICRYMGGFPNLGRVESTSKVGFLAASLSDEPARGCLPCCLVGRKAGLSQIHNFVE
jgi:hypothetical protein